VSVSWGRALVISQELPSLCQGASLCVRQGKRVVSSLERGRSRGSRTEYLPKIIPCNGSSL